MGSHTNPTDHPFASTTRTLLFWCFLWGFIPFLPVPRLEQTGMVGRGVSGSGSH